MNFEREIILLAGSILYKSPLRFKKKGDLAMELLHLYNKLLASQNSPLISLEIIESNIEAFIRGSKDVLYIENSFWRFSPVFDFQLIQLDILPSNTNLLYAKNVLLDLIEDSTTESITTKNKGKSVSKSEPKTIRVVKKKASDDIKSQAATSSSVSEEVLPVQTEPTVKESSKKSSTKTDWIAQLAAVSMIKNSKEKVTEDELVRLIEAQHHDLLLLDKQIPPLHYNFMDSIKKKKTDLKGGQMCYRLRYKQNNTIGQFSIYTVTNVGNKAIVIDSNIFGNLGDQVDAKIVEMLVNLVTASLLTYPNYSSTTSDLGGDIRELYPLWNDLRDGTLPGFPHRPFQYITDRTIKVFMKGAVYRLECLKVTNGNCIVQLQDMEPSDDFTESECVVIDNDLLAFLEADDEEGGGEDIDDDIILEQMFQNITIKDGDQIAPNLLSENRSKFLAKIQKMLDKQSFEKCTVHLFGSSINNLGFKSADVDLSISLQELNPINLHPVQNMYSLANMLRRSGMTNVVPIRSARVPICKFDDPVFKYSCDINVAHCLGVYNSMLLKQYTELDPRVKPFVMLIKFWTKRRDINNPSGAGNAYLYLRVGTPSSYAFSLMGLVFLQANIPDGNERKIVVPEAVRHVRGQKTVHSLREIDVSFYVDESNTIVQEGRESFALFEKDDDWIWNCEKSVAQLFYQFVKYYGYKHSYKATNHISLRHGGLINSVALGRGRLVVLDPFEDQRNCTSMVEGGAIQLLITEFRRAADLIEQGQFDQVFEKIDRNTKDRPRGRRPRFQRQSKKTVG
ncbi:hypothetical protein HDV02_004330 [Globomyces sp. JEL0801]|nr:hypothetical protein HDV02_004330 [Globomyces sp. JEL0801]